MNNEFISKYLTDVTYATDEQKSKELWDVSGILKNKSNRVFKFDDYEQSLKFSQKVAALAEEEDHHPAILLEWGKVEVTWWTHKIGGLHKNDFIAAAKTDNLIT